MKKNYRVEAEKLIYLSAEISASSIEEAHQIVSDMIVEDFDEVGAEFNLTYLG